MYTAFFCKSLEPIFCLVALICICLNEMSIMDLRNFCHEIPNVQHKDLQVRNRSQGRIEDIRKGGSNLQRGYGLVFFFFKKTYEKEILYSNQANH